MTKTDAIIALGANRPSPVGSPRETLEDALRRLGRTDGVQVAARSNFHTTAPVGGPPDQPAYTNAAAVLETSLPADALLDVLQDIEAKLGRDRACEERFGPRTCDLDLLLYGEEIIHDPPRLIVPHPRMHQRRFVLAPLVELAPAWRHPILGKTVVELLAECPREGES
jgi:2-amino-4-hydroxy-6-hydroxymethyldihydropteridine diphosphokinase